VEVTLEYFQSSLASLVYPVQTCTKFKNTFPVMRHNFTGADY
jgi:hypothetical protein